MSGNLTPNFQQEAGNALPEVNPNEMTAGTARFNLDSTSVGGKKKRKSSKRKSAKGKSAKGKSAKRKSAKRKSAKRK